MSDFKFEDFKFSSSAIDDFFDPPEPRVASGDVIRVTSIRDLAGFQRVANDKLIHLSKRDFWRLGQDEEGHFIERLVNDDDGPISE